MPKFEVEVGWRHVIVDTAKLIVEAKTAYAASKKAVKIAEESNQELDWEDGEVVDGSYESTGGVKDVTAKFKKAEKALEKEYQKELALPLEDRTYPSFGGFVNSLWLKPSHELHDAAMIYVNGTKHDD